MSLRQKTLRPVLVVFLSFIAAGLFLGADCKQKSQAEYKKAKNKLGQLRQQQKPGVPATSPGSATEPASAGEQSSAGERILTAQAQPDMSNLTVQSLSLADASGQVRATLRIDESGSPAFVMLDPAGTARTRIILQPDGVVALDLMDQKGSAVTSYWIQDGKPWLAYLDPKGKTVTIIPKSGTAPARLGGAGVAGGAGGATGATAGAGTGAAGTSRGAGTGSEAVGSGGSATTGKAARDRNQARSGGVDNGIIFLAPAEHTYHTQGCAKLHADQKPMNLQDAIGKGYQPCPKCKPPVLESPPLSAPGTGR